MVKFNGTTERPTADNRNKLEECLKAGSLDPGFADLLRILADVLDLRANGKDALLFVGGTQDFSSYSLGVKCDGQKTAIFATSLDGLGEKASSLL